MEQKICDQDREKLQQQRANESLDDEIEVPSAFNDFFHLLSSSFRLGSSASRVNTGYGCKTHKISVEWSNDMVLGLTN